MNDGTRAKAGSEDLAGGLIYTTDSNSNYFSPLKISETATRIIDSWAWMLSAGEISLAALPAPLFSLYNLGVLDGRGQRDKELHAAKLDADRLWLISFGDKDRTEYLLSRLDRAAELADRPDVDDVLDEAWRIYCASLDNVRSAVAA